MADELKPMLRFWGGIVAILIVATSIRMYKLSEPYLWFDESFSVLLSRHALGQIISITARDVHPPLYYVLLHYWIEMWGDSKFSIRGMSALFGVGSVMVVIGLTRLVSSRQAALLAGLLVALSPLALRYSQEARMYTLSAFFLLGATAALIGWVKTPSKYRYLSVYVLLMSASFYTHYISFLCVVSHWCYLLVIAVRKGQASSYLKRPSWWIANACMVVLYIPWLYKLLELFVNLNVLSAEGGLAWIPTASLQTLPSAFWRTLIANSGQDLFWLLYTLPLLLFGLMAGRMVYREQSPGLLRTGVVIYTVLPVCLLFLLSLFRPIFVERYLFFSLIGVPVVIALVIDELCWRSVRFFAVLTLLVAQTSGLSMVYQQREDYDGNRSATAFPIDQVVRHIIGFSTPHDYIVVEGSYWFLAVVYYNQTNIQPQVYYPEFPEYRASGYGSSALFFPYMAQVYLRGLDDMPEGNCRVWWVGSTETTTVFPAGWKELFQRSFGVVALRLFVTAPRPDGTPCPLAPQVRNPTMGKESIRQ